jgi:hypothetical protein
MWQELDREANQQWRRYLILSSYLRDRLLRVENPCHAHLFPTGFVNPRALFVRIFRGRM